MNSILSPKQEEHTLVFKQQKIAEPGFEPTSTDARTPALSSTLWPHAAPLQKSVFPEAEAWEERESKALALVWVRCRRRVGKEDARGKMSQNVSLWPLCP